MVGMQLVDHDTVGFLSIIVDTNTKSSILVLKTVDYSF